MEDTHEQRDFKLRKSRSREDELLVARWLDQWYPTFMPFERGDSTKEEADRYADVADFVSLEGGVFCRNEVKGRSHIFTSREEFPYETIIVMSQQAYDKKVERWGPPARFFELSKDRQYLALIDVETTREKWVEGVIPDGVRGYSANCYLCPIDLVTFLKMNEREEKGNEQRN
jgi:hypothetical protein